MPDIPDLLRLTTEELANLAVIANLERDFELATKISAAVNPRKERARREIAFCLGEVQPIDWLERARAISETFQKNTSGKHHLYVVLLDGYINNSRFGLYVGESRYTPGNRLKQHFSGVRASVHVERHGVCLLPDLYEHLNPLSKPEAKELEVRLAYAFKTAGIRTKGGH